MIERHPIAFYAHGCYVTSMSKKRYNILTCEDIDDFTAIKFVSEIVLKLVGVSSKHLQVFLGGLRQSSGPPVQGDYPRYHSIMSPPMRASLLVPLPLELSTSLPLEVAYYLLCIFCVTPCLEPQRKTTAN